MAQQNIDQDYGLPITEYNGDAGRTRFAWQIGWTVDRVFDSARSFGLKFKEERTGNIWNISGPWNDQTRRFDPFDGRKYNVGEIVDVQLQYRNYTRNDGTAGRSHDINNIRMSASNPLPEPIEQEYSDAMSNAPAPAGVNKDIADSEAPLEPYQSYDDRKQITIGKGQALNLMVELVQSGYGHVLGIEEKQLEKVIRDEIMRLAQGKPIDISYLSPLVQEAINQGGVVTDIEAPKQEAKQGGFDLNE